MQSQSENVKIPFFVETNTSDDRMIIFYSIMNDLLEVYLSLSWYVQFLHCCMAA